MTKRQYWFIFARRTLLVLAGVVVFHVILGIRPSFAAEAENLAAREVGHIRTML